MDNWNNNQEPDTTVSGQFSGNPYQDQNAGSTYSQSQNTANDYSQPQNTANDYGQPQSTADNYGQPQNAGNNYGQTQGAGNAYGQFQNNAGGYGQPQNTANNYGQNNYAYGQPYANYNQSPYQGPSLTPTEMEEPVGLGEWVGLLVLATFVPCIGVILMLVWAFGNTEKKSKSNFCKAFLIVWLIKLAIYAILFIVWGASVAALINEF